MYSEVTITDNSWLITFGYIVCSVFLLTVFIYLKVKQRVFFKYEPALTSSMIVFFSMVQFFIIRFGIDDVYKSFGYVVWDDSSIRYSAMFFFFVYIFFVPDWKAFLRK